ncbi:unnamed protein product [Leuciscus chuanchicus]
MGLEGKLNGQQASKKWENLKRKYKDLKTPKTGSGTDAGEATAATWQYYEDMHEVLGARPSVDPPVVVASFTDEDPVTILMEIVEPSTTSNTIGASSPLPKTGATASPNAASPMATPSPLTPSPRKRKRQTNPILEFLIEESREEQKRHKESEAKTERFLCLFEKLIDKM